MTITTDPDIVPAMSRTGATLWTPDGPRIVTDVPVRLELSGPDTGDRPELSGPHTPDNSGRPADNGPDVPVQPFTAVATVPVHPADNGPDNSDRPADTDPHTPDTGDRPADTAPDVPVRPFTDVATSEDDAMDDTALDALTKADRIRRAFDVLHAPTTGQVREWLAAHSSDPIDPDYLRRIVRAERKRRQLADTQDLPALTAEVLAELDANRTPDTDDRTPDTGQTPDTDNQTPDDTDRTAEDGTADQTPEEPTVPDPATVEIPPPPQPHTASAPAAPVAVVEIPPAESAVTPATQEPRRDDEQKQKQSPIITYGLYAVAVMSLFVSLNTSWRYFENKLHISNAYNERVLMFAVMELALVMCGAGMAVNVRRHGSPGGFRLVVWALCAASAVMAWLMSDNDFAQAAGRIIVGPFLGTVMLHLALGLEFRSHPDRQRATALARIGRELRERLLSRLGLADDDRDAAQRTRDRAAQRAAKLATADLVIARRARVRRAMRAANVAHDPQMMARMLSERDIEQHVDDFRTLERPSPFAAYSAEK